MDEISEIFLFWLAAVFVFLLGFPILGGLGRLVNHLTIRRGWFPPVFAFGGLAAIAIGGSLYLDTAGVLVPGVVVEKRETISTRGGNWSRQMQMGVRYPTAPDHETTGSVGVDEATYDRLRPGAAVRVRYLPQVRMLARLEGQSTRAVLAALPSSDLALTIGAVACAVGLGWAMVTGGGRPGRRLLLAPLFALGLVATVTPQLPPWADSPPDPAARPATAEVRSVRRITRHWFAGSGSSGSNRSRTLRDADQPYELVELVFVPTGRSEPVVAVDAVDIGSPPGLREGATLPITYAEADPRAARLVGATRGHIAANWAQVGNEALWLLGLIGLLLVILQVSRRAGRRIRGTASADT